MAMSARRPRRQRRRPRERASTLPRPAADAADRPAPVVASAPVQAQARPAPRERVEHHVAADYRYVRRDLVVVGVVSAVTLAFVLIAAVLA